MKVLSIRACIAFIENLQTSRHAMSYCIPNVPILFNVNGLDSL